MDENTSEGPEHNGSRGLGFWGCWALTAGGMIGSGIFMLPTVLAPYGLISFGGWLLTAGGSILLALVLARLAGRTTRSGGPYAYAHDAFGDLVGFLNAWGYWVSVSAATPAVALAFVGYLGVFLPGLDGQPVWQAATALALIWTLTLISLTGSRSAGLVQLATTLLKLVPLVIVIALGAAAGDPVNLPEANPTEGALLPTLAATALLTMWAFVGLELGVIPAGEVRDPKRTIPRAVTLGVVTVAIVYIASTAAVMMLVPAEQLAASTSPFADAVARLGDWAPLLIAAGAMVSTGGALNANIFISGQMPLAVAMDGLAPERLARKNAAGAPVFALLLSSTVGSILLLMNFSSGLVGAFTALVTMSTLFTLAPLLFSAAAELRHSWASARGWAGVAGLAALYGVFAIIGSGFEAIALGAALAAAGIPLFYLLRRPGTGS